MSKFNELTRQFMDWWSAPETPAPSAPAASATVTASAATPAADAPAAAAPAADTPDRPAPRWKALPRTRAARFYPQVVELADVQGCVALRFYVTECRRTLMSPRRLPLPQAACLPGPLFALEENALAYAGTGQGQEGQPVLRSFRYELPPILYASAQEMGVILQQTRQEVTRLLENHRVPALPREAPVPEETVVVLAQVPPDWLDAPPLEVPYGLPMDVPDGPLAELEAQQAPAAEDAAPENKPPIEEWTGVIEQWLPKGGKAVREGGGDTPVLRIQDDAKGGEITPIRGKDLLRAMKEAHAQTGDRVLVRHVENTPVEVYQKGDRKRGAYKKIFYMKVLEQRMPGR